MNGILLLADDAAVRQEAKRRGLAVEVAAAVALPFERTLVVGPSVQVPWDLVGPGFAFLDRWEAASPLAGGVLAASLGSEAERTRTQRWVRDLRVPVYGSDLLFVRRCPGGEQLVAAWREECAEGGDRQLAFLHALYRVKPLFLALPRTWLQARAAVAAPVRRRPNGLVNLVHVEIAPGRSVCCRPDEVEMYKQRFAQMRTGRRC